MRVMRQEMMVASAQLVQVMIKDSDAERALEILRRYELDFLK